MTCIHFLSRSNTVPQYLNTKNEALHRFQYPSWFMNKSLNVSRISLAWSLHTKILTGLVSRSWVIKVRGQKTKRLGAKNFFRFHPQKVKYNFSGELTCPHVKVCFEVCLSRWFSGFRTLGGSHGSCCFLWRFELLDHRRLKFSRFSEVEILKVWGSSVEIVWFIPSMEEIPKANHQLGCFWNPGNNGINTPQPQLVSRISEHLALCCWTWRESWSTV